MATVSEMAQKQFESELLKGLEDELGAAAKSSKVDPDLCEINKLIVDACDTSTTASAPTTPRSTTSSAPPSPEGPPVRLPAKGLHPNVERALQQAAESGQGFEARGNSLGNYWSKTIKEDECLRQAFGGNPTYTKINFKIKSCFSNLSMLMVVVSF